MQKSHKRRVFLSLFALGVFNSQANLFAMPIDAIVIGGGERGIAVGLESSLSSRDQVELGIQGIRANVTNVDIGLSSPVPVLYESLGTRIAYNRFLQRKTSENGLFLQFSLAFQSIRGSAKVSGDNQQYDIGGITFTCSECGTIKLKTDSRPIDLIPGIAVGWQFILSKRLRLKTLVGVQYYNVPTTTWESQRVLPKFATDQLDKATASLNREIQSLPDFYPTALLSISYQFR